MAHKDIETRNAYRKKWREANKDKVIAQRQRYKANKASTPKVKQSTPKVKLTPEQVKERKKKYYEANKDKLRKVQQDWRNKNKEVLREKQKEKYYTDNLYRLKSNIKNLIGNSLRNNNFKKLSRTEQILGCSYDEFKLYLESKFETWMNWDNRGLYNGKPLYGWDIDHIIPLKTATCEADIIRLNHYTNLQPLCSHYNRDIKKYQI